MWSDTHQHKATGDWLIISGLAYPRVVPGGNVTDTITSSASDRDAFYNDPAIRLSEDNLDKFNGTQGMPLCVEHDPNDVVGYVQHSWLKDGALKIVGKIDLRTERGRQVAASIKSGEFKGLSVGYGISTAGSQCVEKKFYEISIVAEPFFRGCDLSYSVAASKGTKNDSYLSTPRIYCTIQMSETPTAAAVPTSAPAVSGEELLTEVSKLKAQQEEANRAKIAMEQELKRLQQKEDAWNALEKERADKYSAEQMPKAERYIEALTASGIKLTEERKASYRMIYCDERTADAARDFDAQMAHMQSIQASAKKSEQEAAELKERLTKMESAVNQTTQVLNHSRNSMNNALSTAAAAAADVSVNASAANVPIGHMMIAAPSVADKPFLEALGFFREVGVTASADGSPLRPLRPTPRSIPLAPEHPMLYDEKGNRELAASLRYTSPFFHLIASNRTGLGKIDLASMVKPALINKSDRLDSAEAMDKFRAEANVQ